MTDLPSTRSPSNDDSSPQRRNLSPRWKQPSTRFAIWFILMVSMSATTMNVSKMAGQVLFADDVALLLEESHHHPHHQASSSSQTATATSTKPLLKKTLMKDTSSSISSTATTSAAETGSNNGNEKQSTTKSTSPRPTISTRKEAVSSDKKKSKQQESKPKVSEKLSRVTKNINNKKAELMAQTKGVQSTPVTRVVDKKKQSNATKAMERKVIMKPKQEDAPATKKEPSDKNRAEQAMPKDHDQQQQHPLRSPTRKPREAAQQVPNATRTTHVSLGDSTNNSLEYNYSRYYTPLAINTTNLWDNSTILPSWLKEYFHWHQQERHKMNADPRYWKTKRFLIPTASKGTKSGGTTDRIRPLPAYLRLAAQTKRILLFHWGRPFALEEFLVPPAGGMDWRVPDYMLESVLKSKPLVSWGPLEREAHKNKKMILTAKYQSWNYGELWYKEQTPPDEATVYQTFKDMWHVVFTPSPPVAQRIQDNFGKMGLKQGEFATAHIRALYAVKDRPMEHIQAMARNALNCASNLRPGGPFFIASDSTSAVQTAIQYGREKNVTVVAANHPTQALHVDFHNESDTTVKPADFYDGFVDLYLMGATRCVAIGPGGFARWGNLLGYNDTCAIHHHGRKSQTCKWMAATNDHGSRPMPGYPSEEERLLIQAKASTNQLPRFPMPMLQ